MSQSSFLSTEAARRVRVLVPYPLSKAYDYALPAGMTAGLGDYVRVSFRGKETQGVVWSLEGEGKADDARLKPVAQRYEMPAMTEAHRRFLDWVSRYTMSDLGSVLKMSLSAPEAFDPPKAAQAYSLSGALSGKISAPRQRVIDVLRDGMPRRAAEIAETASCTAALIRAMADAGQLRILSPEPVFPCSDIDLSPSPLVFSQEQEEAAKALGHIARADKYAAVLLDGVTGSGKTEVYFEAVAEALKSGRQALILLPEIALSSQFLSRFRRRFGTEPAIWHSEVSQAQRRVVWAGVAEGKTKVVIGARSALFLPFAGLGLIVVDEEHEASYKQEEGVMYNARDMSIVRGQMGDFPVVLVSATPSLESVVNVQQGKYAYLRLPSRHAGAKMPDIHVIDLKKTPPERQRFMSPELVGDLRKNLDAGEQSLLFLNRRGYAPLTLCRTCGHRFQCPSCSAWLVEHRRHARMQCHHCGFAQAVPRACPSCREEESLAACGPGVERIEEEVRTLFPEARTLILASDSVTTPKMIAETIVKIEKHEVDIIIGTQIIAKGHHFPSLTLVGVIDADLGLSGGDLRAGERTFQLLHQVSGRAGRGEKSGRVFLQTYMPEQSVIRALAANDRDAFLAAEKQERERAAMPPFGRLAALIVSGADETKLDYFCRNIAQIAPRYDDIRILGPAPAPLAFLRGRHRRRFLVKTGKAVNIQKFLSEWLGAVKAPSGIQLKIDIDPQSFF